MTQDLSWAPDHLLYSNSKSVKSISHRSKLKELHRPISHCFPQK